MQTIILAKPLTLTLDNGLIEFYPAGTHAVEDAVADHWFTKLHLRPVSPPALGDFAYAEALRREANVRKEAFEAADAEATAAEEAFAAKQAAAAEPVKEDAPPETSEGDGEQPAGSTGRKRIKASEG